MNKNTLILVVEDEDDIAEILMSYLERSGMKTLRARQGEQAIALNRLHKPDLILLDIHLPYATAGASSRRFVRKVPCPSLWFLPSIRM